MDIGIFQYIAPSIEAMTQKFMIDGAQNIMDAIKPLVYTGLTLYIALQGYLQLAGKSDDLAVDVVIACLVVLCLSLLTLNIGNYTTYIIGGVQALGDGLASAIPSTTTSNPSNIYETLDKMLQTGVKQMVYCFGKMGYTPSSWLWLICGVVVILAIGALTVVGAVIIIGTKFLLSMLLLVGPIFIIMACFPPTRRFLDNWMGKVFENILVQIFAVAVITMMLTLMENYLLNNDLADAANPSAIVAQILVLSWILVFVLKQIPNLAGSLAGGFAAALLTLPRLPKPQPEAPNPERISDRPTWQQQQQNQISGGGAARDASPKYDLSQDLQDRIAEHNLKHR